MRSSSLPAPLARRSTSTPPGGALSGHLRAGRRSRRGTGELLGSRGDARGARRGSAHVVGGCRGRDPRHGRSRAGARDRGVLRDHLQPRPRREGRCQRPTPPPSRLPSCSPADTGERCTSPVLPCRCRRSLRRSPHPSGVFSAIATGTRSTAPRRDWRSSATVPTRSRYRPRARPSAKAHPLPTRG